jgi:prephenate dehydrogenase
MTTPVKQISIIGVGLIGGSFAAALKANGCKAEIVGYGRSVTNLQKGVALGVIDRYEQSIEAAVTGSDLILLAVPVGSMQEILPQLKSAIEAGAIITDVGSTKGSVVEALRTVFGEVPSRFIPGHPIAGTEKSGVEAAFPELFTSRRVILTPLESSDPEALEVVRKLWQQTGAEVSEMSVARHDDVLAATSHLPHLLAFTLVDTLANLDEHEDIFRYAAGGFRDFTRIASSDPQMWHDICLNNREALLAIIERYQQDLQALTEAIRAGDGVAIRTKFERAKAERDAYCDGNG